MKYLLLFPLLIIAALSACRKDVVRPQAVFSFRDDTSSVLRMGTYDTCTLINASVNADSSFWDLGDGSTSRERNPVISYSSSGTYQVSLRAKNRDGSETFLTKKVVVLDRVLRKIIIKEVYWDTIPNNIPNFNSVWPTTSKAGVFVQVQQVKAGDSVVPYSGIFPNSQVLYKSPVIPDVASHTTVPITIDVPGKFIIDKKMVLGWGYLISIMAIDKNNIQYSLASSMEGGSTLGIRYESFADNSFVLFSGLFSYVEFDCDFE
jgi:PKD repeat protein